MAKDNNNKKLDILIQAVEKLAANPVAVVAPVAPVLPIAPVLPVAAIAPVNTGDHDFLLTFSSEVKVRLDNIVNAIQNLTDGTATKINDHDKKITQNSDDIIKIQTQQKVWGIALSVGWGVLLVLLKFFKVL